MIIVLLIVAALIFFSNKKSSITTHVPVSIGDYSSHLDFLAMHGFITEEEIQAQRDFQTKIDSGEYKSVSLKELMESEDAN